jgi:hypothetical protein
LADSAEFLALWVGAVVGMIVISAGRPEGAAGPNGQSRWC